MISEETQELMRTDPAKYLRERAERGSTVRSLVKTAQLAESWFVGLRIDEDVFFDLTEYIESRLTLKESTNV